MLIDQKGVRSYLSSMDNPFDLLLHQLHASDLRNLSPSSSLAQTLNGAASTLELPYVSRSASNPFSNLAGAVAERCGARVVTHVPGKVSATVAGGEKHVVCVEMPPLDGLEGADRKKAVVEHGTWLVRQTTARM